ncbi:glutathione S-transferase 1-like [Anthonomus grandis grandis]|uniref:glutathione S-transferase 1-like n=1 Tax=Anthonomus grandis grandis TaxID=2921223 RepID=UPI0021664550|nr:glutathione S-transferase 1-like [Anthonomus grandis grandis]
MVINLNVNIMVKKLYMVEGSPVANAILMAARAFDVELELQQLDFAKQEYLEDWYLQINPAHTVPALDDDGFIVWDSHVILIYLAETYGSSSTLFSNIPKVKYKILQMLNFNCGTVFRRLSDCLRPIFYENQKTIEQKYLESLKDSYKVLERILESSKFMAADTMTIADISLFSSIAVTDLILPVTDVEYPRLREWLIDMKNTDLYKAGEQGVDTLKNALDVMLEM